MTRRALIIVNVGTPVKPTLMGVGKFLVEFLNDRRVIDIPWLLRKFLVNGIIIPFRLRRSTGLYRKLWTPEGSPIRVYEKRLGKKLQEQFGQDTLVFNSMRYGKPSLTATLKRLENAGIGEIIIFPMYPQYASSTTGSVVEKAIQLVQKWEVIPSIRIIAQYYSHPEFIRAYARQVRKYLSGDLDHIVISYHGLPVQQVDKVHPDVRCADCRCDLEMPVHGSYCYRATCYETTRLISAELKLDHGSVSTAFQSRLSRNWLAPFTDEIIGERAELGDKKILIMAPSFVTDCLETTIELGYEYRELFLKKGGEELVVVESLNDQDHWAQAIRRIIDGNK